VGLLDGLLGNASELDASLDLDAELRIWVTGSAEPLQVQFNKRLSIYEVQSTLAAYVLR
jgi:hypothetical protein